MMISQSTDTKGLRAGEMLISKELRIDKGWRVDDSLHIVRYQTLFSHPEGSD